MANRISKDKKQLSIVLTLDQIKRLDDLAAELGTSRTALVSEAVDALLDGGESPAPVSSDSARIETAIAKLDALAANQAAIKADQVAHTTLLADAIKNQPIAVQQLPAEPPSLQPLSLPGCSMKSFPSTSTCSASRSSRGRRG